MVHGGACDISLSHQIPRDLWRSSLLDLNLEGTGLQLLAGSQPWCCHVEPENRANIEDSRAEGEKQNRVLIIQFVPLDQATPEVKAPGPFSSANKYIFFLA